jgi:hypothetical protein
MIHRLFHRSAGRLLDSRRIDMVRLGLIACLMVASFPVKAANAQTFGLGVSSEVHVTVSTFGLGSAVVFTPTAKQEVVKPDTPPPAISQRTTVVRRARSYWTEGGRPWTVETLRVHLVGHRVPSGELSGRTLVELINMHDNIHEGFGWSGVTRTTARTVSSCPGGVCPTPSYQPRRLFRR